MWTAVQPNLNKMMRGDEGEKIQQVGAARPSSHPPECDSSPRRPRTPQPALCQNICGKLSYPPFGGVTAGVWHTHTRQGASKWQMNGEMRAPVTAALNLGRSKISTGCAPLKSSFRTAPGNILGNVAILVLGWFFFSTSPPTIHRKVWFELHDLCQRRLFLRNLSCNVVI